LPPGGVGPTACKNLIAIGGQLVRIGGNRFSAAVGVAQFPSGADIRGGTAKWTEIGQNAGAGIDKFAVCPEDRHGARGGGRGLGVLGSNGNTPIKPISARNAFRVRACSTAVKEDVGARRVAAKEGECASWKSRGIGTSANVSRLAESLFPASAVRRRAFPKSRQPGKG
jgi:hypothetical protein